MDKFILLATLLISCTLTQAKTCYVGDSIAHSYRLSSGGLGKTRVGSNPKQVLGYLQSSVGCDKFILSSRISNNPVDFDNVSKQLYLIKDRPVKLLGTSVNFPKYGNSLNSKLSFMCGKYPNCTFNGGFIPSKDRVHPTEYGGIK